MLTLRKSEERGHFNHGWLETYHTFSFADYHDPAHMRFRQLRVINDDRVAPGMGFGMHPHRDMEIVTYLVEGTLEHKDSMGNGDVLHRGDVQAMTAGTGITHSEFNPSPHETVHLLQIWIRPEQKGLTPSYQQKPLPDDEKRGRLRLIVSHDGRDGSIRIHQDVDVYATLLNPADSVFHRLASGRHAWIQIVQGSVTVNGQPLQTGDGAAVSNETDLVLRAEAHTEALLFDLN